MATLINKKKLAVVNRSVQDKHPRNNLLRDTDVFGVIVEFITQAVEEFEGKVTEKLFQDISRAETRSLGALSKLDEFFLNSQVRVQSGTVPGTSRNSDREN